MYVYMYVCDTLAAFEAYNKRRWGSSSWTGRLIQMGRKHGANFSNWKWWPNTTKCHQFIALMNKNGISTHACNAAIFEAMYEEGQNVSLAEVLAKIAADKLDVRLASEEIVRYLEEDTDSRKEMGREISEGRAKYDISGVPFFVVGRTDSDRQPYGMSGAQDPATLRRVFENLLSDS